MKISHSSYKKILKEVQKSIQLAQNKITRDKVEMAWNIGKTINNSMPKERAEEYGQSLIILLERDTSISKQVLYKMRNFYQAYPKLPKDDPQLNWSHYRVLSGVKEASERQALEDLTRENSWNSDELQKEASRRKDPQAAEENLAVQAKSSLTNSDESVSPPLSKEAIKPNRGKVYTYRIIEVIGSEKKFFDCGFGIFSEVTKQIPQNVTISEDKNSKQLYTFKAYLKRIVDGDTIHANIDLGFGIWHEEIIRLAKINAAEARTDEGEKATAELTKILTEVPFFVLKSIKTDIYNRYVADIFLPEKNETDLQKIADKGVYLNQLLLDRGVAEVF